MEQKTLQNIKDKFSRVYLSRSNTEFLHQHVNPSKTHEEILSIARDLLDSSFDKLLHKMYSESEEIKFEIVLHELNRLVIQKTKETVKKSNPNTNPNTNPNPKTNPNTNTSLNPNTNTNLNTNLNTEQQDLFLTSKCNSNFSEGLYTFELLENASIEQITFLRVGDFYNIDNSNNIISFVEKNHSIRIVIPCGNYSIESLLLYISKEASNKSLNKQKYNLQKCVHTSKIIVSCHSNLNSGIAFGLEFNDKLGEMLGFKLNKYFNNSTYISEDKNTFSRFDTLFVKLYINDNINQNIILPFVHLKSCSFIMSHEKISLKTERQTIKTISLEIFNSYGELITNSTELDILLSLTQKSP